MDFDGEAQPMLGKHGPWLGVADIIGNPSAWAAKHFKPSGKFKNPPVMFW